MGILNTVIRKPETTLDANDIKTDEDEKKVLVNINSRVEDLRVLNMENAKFLRGVSRKIESELYQMRELTENHSIDGFDDTDILESIERTFSGIDDVKSGIDRLNESINKKNSTDTDVAKEIREVKAAVSKVNDSLGEFDYDKVVKELDKVNDAVCNVNTEVILIEIDKINKELKSINGAGSVLDEIAKTNDKLDEIKANDLLGEIHRVETIVSEINENAVLSELDKLKKLIEEKNSTQVLNSVDERIRRLSPKDYTDSLLEIKQMLDTSEAKSEELSKKLDRVATMPTMVKSVLDKMNQENLQKIEEIMTEINDREKKKFENMRMMLNINLWVSFLTLAIVIARILQFI